MARSGSFNTSGYSVSDGNRYLTFSWSILSQDVAANTTTISWSLKGGGTSSQYIYSGNFKVVIDGKTVYTYTDRMQLYSGTTIASGNYTLAHNDDGTKSFKASAEGGIYYWAVNCSGSKTFEIDAIARASQPSCITYPEHTQNVGNFGDTISIHMNRHSSEFTHTVRYAFGDLSGTCINAETGKAATGIGTGFRWKIPESFMDLLPQNVTGSGTIYVDTYHGSTKIGTKYCGFTATVPASVKPKCTIQVLDNTPYQERYGSLVQGLSQLYVKVNDYPAYSSPIKSYNVTVNGDTHKTNEFVTGVLKNPGNVTVTATVTDSRGRTSDKVSASFPVLDYAPPKITALSVHRCNEDGTANDRGDYVKVTFSSEISPIDSRNGEVYKVSYKKSTDSDFTEERLGLYGYEARDIEYIFEADGSSSYEVEVSVTDNHNTAKMRKSAPTAFTLMNFHPSGTALRFGGVAEKANTLQNDLDFVQVGNQYCFASVGTDGTQGFVKIAEIAIKQYYIDAPIVFELIQRDANTPMVVNVLFVSDGVKNPALRSVWYEGTNYDAYLTETASGVWGLYVKKSKTYDDITLSRWYTAEYMTDRISVTFPGELVDTVPLGLRGYYHATPAVLQSIIDCLLPVGMIIHLYSHANPNAMYPGTTWERLTNTFLWGCDASGDIGITGGEKTHSLTVAELPTHTHGSVYSGNVDATKTHAWLASGGSAMAYGTVETGGGAAHNNMPPYTQVSIWRRTA
jgi:hypothetical protein